MRKNSQAALAVAVLALGAITPAMAHVTLQTTQATIGASYRAVLVVPHGCGNSATTRLTVTVPEGMVAVKPVPKPGWSIEITKGAYQQSYPVMHGDPVSEGVKTISWSGRLDGDYYDEFVFVGAIAATLSDGATLAFPVNQQCEAGKADWTEIAAAGQDPHSLKSPAPLLRLVAAAGRQEASFAKGDIVVTKAWSRATPGATKIGAGYLTIENKGASPDRLLGGSTDAAAKIEVHEMAMANGVMTMRALDAGLAIPPGKSVTLGTGGDHLMIVDLKKPLKQGESFKATLQFEKAGPIDVTFDVLGLGAKGPGEGASAPADGMMDHSKMNMDHSKMKM